MICERPSGQVISLASPKTIVKSASYLVPERSGNTNPHLAYTLSRFLETDTRLVFDSTGRKEKLPKLHMRDLPIETSKISGIPRSLAKLRPNYVEPPPRKATTSRFLNPNISIDSDVRVMSASPVMRRRDETTDRLGIGKISRSISSNEFIREAQRLNSSLSQVNHRSERDLKRHKQLQRSATTSKIAANQTFRVSRPSSRNENEDGYSRMR